MITNYDIRYAEYLLRDDIDAANKAIFYKSVKQVYPKYKSAYDEYFIKGVAELMPVRMKWYKEQLELMEKALNHYENPTLFT